MIRCTRAQNNFQLFQKFFYNNQFNDFYFMHLNGANVGRKDKKNNQTDAIMCFQIPISHPEFCKLNKVIYCCIRL